MKRFFFGALVGGILAAVATTIFFLSQLPGAPSQYSPTFPVVASPPPRSLWHPTSVNRVGYDIYGNIKGRPLLTADATIPTKKTTTWSASSQQNGIYYMRQTLWVEARGTLYEIANAEKQFNLSPNRFFAQVNTLSVTSDRKVSIIIEAPELDVRETFGPYDLP
jgi:hypothetical protein